MSFRLLPLTPSYTPPSPTTIPPCLSQAYFTPLYLYHLPKLAVYLSLRVIALDGFHQEGIFRKSVNQSLLKEYMAIIDNGFDLKDRWDVVANANANAGTETGVTSNPNTSSLFPSQPPAHPLPYPHTLACDGAAAASAAGAAFFPVNAKFLQVNEECKDPHMYAAMYKLWVRGFEEPLIPFDKYDIVIKFIVSHWAKTHGTTTHSTPLTLETKVKDFVTDSDQETSATAVTKFFNRVMPPLNVMLLKYLVRFLRLFTLPDFLDVNRMTEENLAIVWGPNLVRREVPNPKEDPKTVVMKEQPLLRVLIRDLRITDDEHALFDDAERDVAAEYGIDVGDFYRGVLAEREQARKKTLLQAQEKEK